MFITDSCSECCTINNSKILTHLIISQTSKYFLQDIKFVRANFHRRLVPGKKCRVPLEMLFYISCSNLLYDSKLQKTKVCTWDQNFIYSIIAWLWNSKYSFIDQWISFELKPKFEDVDQCNAKSFIQCNTFNALKSFSLSYNQSHQCLIWERSIDCRKRSQNQQYIQIFIERNVDELPFIYFDLWFFFNLSSCSSSCQS